MPQIPTLLCIPVGIPHHTGITVRFSAADLAIPIAREIAAGRLGIVDDISQGRLPPVTASDAVAEPEAKAMAWQGRLTFEGLSAAGEAFLARLGSPERAAAYVRTCALLSGAGAKASGMRKLAKRVRTLWHQPAPPCDALFFPDTGSFVDFADLEGYIRGRVRAGAWPPFALPVSALRWPGIDPSDLHAAAAECGRSSVDTEALLRASLALFGPDAPASVAKPEVLKRIVTRWAGAPAGDSAAENALSINLARWNALQNIQIFSVGDHSIVPLRDGLDAEDAAAWCRRRALEIRLEARAAAVAWTMATAEKA